MKLKHFGKLSNRERFADPDILKSIDTLAEKLEVLFVDFNKEHCSKCDGKEHLTIRGEYIGIQRGCCYKCSLNEGYLFPEQLKQHKDDYWVDNTYGFFNPVLLTCNLPRARRSVTCLSTSCSKLPVEDRNAGRNLAYALGALRYVLEKTQSKTKRKKGNNGTK